MRIGVIMFASASRVSRHAEVSRPGIVHQDVGSRRGLERRVPALRGRNVAADGINFNLVGSSDFLGRLLELLLPPRGDHQVHAFARERDGAAFAESLGRRAHERGAAANSEIHVSSFSVKRAALRR
jgi:hypothetical protein